MGGLSSERSDRIENSSAKGRSRLTISGTGVGERDIDQSGIWSSSGLPSGMGSSSSISTCIAVVDRDLDGDREAALLTGVGCLGKGELIDNEGTVSIDNGW
jgi:hypothetical protein